MKSQFITGLLLTYGCLTAFADHHQAPAQALAMEAAVCNLNEGRSEKDLDRAFDAFKVWAKKINYDTYLTRNTPLYTSGQTQLDLLVLEFTSYEQMGKGWDQIAENGQEMLAGFDRAATCRRTLSHYLPLHVKANWEPDDDRIMTINWCTRRESVTWDQISEEHASWTFNEHIGYAGLVIPALGIKTVDFPESLRT